jgi:serine O-acetyltransferase
LVYARSIPFIGWFAYYLLKILGIEIPRSVVIGEDFTLVHGGYGVVMHRDSIIGDRVKIYPDVVLGREDIHLSAEESKF